MKTAFRAAAVLTFLLGSGPHLEAQLTLAIANTTTKNWSLGAYGEADLTAGAGSDFVTSWETIATFVTMTISGGTGGWTWKVAVKRTDTAWNAGLHLYVRRTDDGTGAGGSSTIDGGLAYQEITIGNVAFFSGLRARNNVTVQLRLDGVSAVLGPGSFSTTVSYTVTEP